MDFFKRTIKFFSTKPNSNNERETKRRRVSNNSQKTPLSVTRSQTKTPRSVTRSQTKTPLSVTRSQTKTPRSVTRSQTKTPRPNNTNNTINNNQKNVTKKKSTKPLPQKGKNRNDSTLGEQQEKRYRKIKNIIKQNKIKIQPNSIKTNTKKANIQNIIKMFNTKSQYISNNKSENIPRALKYISKSTLLTGKSIERQKIPFNKLNEKTSSIIETIKNGSIKLKTNQIDLIASDKDFNIDFLFLVYLDIVHDETYTGSFNEFLKSRIAKILCKKVPKFKVTTMIGNIIEESEEKITNNNNIIEAKKGFEKILKLKLNEIFETKWVVNKDVSTTSIVKNEKRLNVILDSEKGQGGTASGTGSQISALIGSSKNGKTRSLKPLITLGSLFDPGKNMVQWGITRDIPNLFGKNPKTSSKWCLYTMNFNINKNTYISLRHNGKEYVLKINGKEIPIGLSKSNAQNNKTNNRKMLSKFMGDFLQNLYGVGIMYHYRKDKNIPPICLGTTDGNNTLMYAFMVHRILGQKPKIILDLSKNNEILLYNLNGYFTLESTPTIQSKTYSLNTAQKTTVQQVRQTQKQRPLRKNPQNMVSRKLRYRL